MTGHGGTHRGQAEQASGPPPELAAAQAALAAEHAAVYGYGVVGAWAGSDVQGEVTRLLEVHRVRRDGLRGTVRALGGSPVAAAAGYALPFEVSDADSALSLAAVLEEGLAGVYADLVRAAEGEQRRAAAAELREAAVRAARWRRSPLPFPGLDEYRERDAAADRTDRRTDTVEERG